MISTEEVIKKIKYAMPDVNLLVEDMTGNGNHFVIDAQTILFDGKTKLQQHKMIYKALGSDLENRIHALQIKTSVPLTPKSSNE